MIDDNEDFLWTLKQLIGAMGCNFFSCTSAREGLQLAKKTIPEFIFCDLVLPGELDGYGFIKELRTQANLRHIPTCALTAYSNANITNTAVEHGFDNVLIKPIRFSDLRGFINIHKNPHSP